jgi:PIN domain
MTKKNITRIILNVVFDTNALHTVVSHDLLNTKVQKFIANNSNHKDVDINWCIPEVVILERTFQMLSKGKETLPSIAKLEQLLGHRLNITEQILKDRVETCIKNQLTDLKIDKVCLDTSNVNWQKIIEDSTARNPPFENNQKEKGFRDAVILETFAQIVLGSVTDPKKCRNILISEDSMLVQAANERFSKFSNVKILPTIEKCEELINLITNEVTEETIKSLEDKISLYFYDREKNSGIYFDNNIGNQIENQFKKELRELYTGSTSRENGSLSYYPPVFSHKEGQKFFWITEVCIEGICYRKELIKKVEKSHLMDFQFDRSNPIPTLWNNPILSENIIREPYKGSIDRNLYEKYLQPKEEFSENKITVVKCNCTFNVIWSLVIKTNKSFGSSKLESIEFVENEWLSISGEQL